MALKEEKEFAISGKQKDSVRRETSSFRHEIDDRAPTPKATRWKRVEKKKRQRQKSDWQNSSTTVRIQFERYLYEITL